LAEDGLYVAVSARSSATARCSRETRLYNSHSAAAKAIWTTLSLI